MMTSSALRIVLFGAAGVALGYAYFAALRFNASLYLGPGRRGRAALLHLARILVLAAVLAGVARAGALALVATFIGLSAARPLVAGSAQRTGANEDVVRRGAEP